MILLLELQCVDWEHNRVNSEFIRQLLSAKPEDEIKLYAEKRHIKNLGIMLEKYGSSVKSESIELFDYHGKNEERADDYADIISGIIESNKNVEKVILLSCNKGIILAVGKLAEKYKNIVFLNILHSALEAVCVENMKKPLRTAIFELLWSIKHLKKYPVPEVGYPMSACLEGCNYDNISFLVYSPCYNDELKGKISDSIIEKITFIHHPFFDSNFIPKESSNDTIVVGVYGQAVNDNALQIIDTYNSSYDNGTVVFKVMTKYHPDLLAQENVEVLVDGDYVSNDELEKAISELDYILIPYDKNQYKVTASGIFCDAVSIGIPLLTLDSAYFNYYSRYGVLKMFSNIKDLARTLPNLCHEDGAKREIAMRERELKKLAFSENVSKIKAVIKNA